ncbi:MAG: hypothetical protein JSV23_03135 [Promethearchaeota archaeon]|nr:MAG: hypothetical protein JSV23_03135 [Candidatus Lokiarchaeota archaeon]
MKVNIKYHEIVEEFLEKELEWFKEEFEILFKSKMENFTKKDKKIANDILDYILENTYVHDNIILLNLLNETLENIEKEYSNLL